MNKIKKYQRNLIGIAVFLSYFIYNFFQDVPLAILGIDYQTMSLTAKVIYLLLYELIFVLILFLIYHKQIEENFKDYVKNFKPYYIKKYMRYWAFAFGLMIVSNMVIVSLLPNSVQTNQQAINQIFEIAPIYIIISSVIFAPLIEELVFRLSFRYMFENDKMFIITSGLIFGAMHVIGSFTNWVDLAYIIPYSIPGLVFAYTLKESENIFVPMSLHLFHNGLMMTLQVILTLI